MANDSIRGIAIELGADTSDLGKAIGAVEKQSYNLTDELKQVEKALKFDPSNVTLLAQKQEILTQNIDATAQKLETLKTVQSQVQRQFESGDITVEQYRAFQREIQKTSSYLNKLKRDLSETNSATSEINKLANSFKKVGSAAATAGKEIGSALGNAGTVGAAAVGGLVTSMQETNEQLGMLKVQANEAGVSLEGIDQARGAFASVGQDVNQTTEAMGNLIQAGYATSDSINDISTSLAGAVVKYGETFNVEGLAESITTTTQLGEVTGQLMDLFEKEGINVDDFNTKMQSMSTAQERANYISQLLANQGLASMYDEYVKLNPEATANAQAQLNLQTALADLATVLSPLVTKIAEITTAFVEWATENPGLTKALGAISIIIAGIAGAFATLMPAVGALVSIWPVLTAAFTGFSAPVLIVIGVIAALGAAFIALWKNSETFREGVSATFEAVKSAIMTALGVVVEFVRSKIDEIIAFWDENGTQILQAAQNVFNGIKAVVDFVMPAVLFIIQYVWNAIQSVISGALDVIMGLVQIFTGIFTGDFSKMWEGVKQVFTGAIDLIMGWMSLTFVGGIRSLLTNLTKSGVTLIKGMWDNIVKFFTSMGTKASSTTSSLVTNVLNFFKNLATNGKNTVSNMVTNVINFVKNLATNFVNSISTMKTNVISKISELKTSLINKVKEIDLVQIGKDIIKGLISGISNMTGDAIEAISGVVGGVIDKAKSLLDSHSPSRVFIGLGEDTNQGYINGIEATSGQVTRSIEGAYGSIANSAQNMLSNNQRVDSFQFDTNSLVNGISNALQGANSNGSPIVLQINLDGYQVAQATYNHVSELQNLQQNRLKRFGV